VVSAPFASGRAKYADLHASVDQSVLAEPLAHNNDVPRQGDAALSAGKAHGQNAVAGDFGHLAHRAIGHRVAIAHWATALAQRTPGGNTRSSDRAARLVVDIGVGGGDEITSPNLAGRYDAADHEEPIGRERDIGRLAVGCTHAERFAVTAVTSPARRVNVAAAGAGAGATWAAGWVCWASTGAHPASMTSPIAA